MMRWARLLHIYAGLLLSVLLLVLAVTGALLIYKEAWWRLTHPELRIEQPRPSAEEQAVAINAAWHSFGERLRSVKMPEPGVPAWHLYLEDGEEAFLDYATLAVFDHWHLRDRFMGFLFDLHAHLLSGSRGEIVGGVIGLAGAVMVLTGMVLWWPARRRFRLSSLWPRGLSRRVLLFWHRDTGMLISPVLLLLLLTGSGMVFYTAAQALFNGMFRDPTPVLSFTPPDLGRPMRLPGTSTLQQVKAHFPDARLVFYYPPKDGSGVHGFRLKRPCELHPNGRSYLYLDADNHTVAHKVDACGIVPGERIVNTIYPLHAAKTPSSLYKLLAFIASLGLAGLSLTGVITYIKRLRRRRAVA